MAVITFTALTGDDARRCSKIARHRMQLDTLPDGKMLRLRKASMGGLAGCRLTQYIHSLGITRIFEIGTCAGIGAAYLCSAAEANGRVHFTGMEGVPEKIEIANKTLARFTEDTEYVIVPGLFQDSFEEALALAKPLEFVYLDGWHKQVPTVQMFNRCVEEMPQGGVIVVDDLNQTINGMQEAGRQLRRHSRVIEHTAFAGKESFVIGETSVCDTLPHG